MMRRQDVWPLAALGFVLGVSAAWWTFALWSVPGAPAWLERARTVCFNITDSGLPDAKGWLLLLGEPPTMMGFLLVGWRDEVMGALRRLVAVGWGRVVAAGAVGLTLVGLGLAGVKVADARLPAVAWGEAGVAPADHPRLDRPWPDVDGLIGHDGSPFGGARIAGRPALVLFAFGHCETLCPVIVEQAVEARRVLAEDAGGGAAWSVVVYTLDPWRDTPSRLPTLHRQWGLDPDRDFVVGGPIERVERALDAWGVARARDPRTGDIVHSGVAFLVEPDGTVAYAATGGVERLVSLGALLHSALPASERGATRSPVR